jgi:uncharacterized protein (DUF2461 family)
MLEIDPLLETRSAIGKTLSRIHRDTRFSHDKSLYAQPDVADLQTPGKELDGRAGLLFEISPDTLRYGTGYYSASKSTMDLFRHTLKQRPAISGDSR